MSDPRFKTVKYGERGRDWDMQIALVPCEHEWLSARSEWDDLDAFKCTRCGKVEYAERAD